MFAPQLKFQQEKCITEWFQRLYNSSFIWSSRELTVKKSMFRFPWLIILEILTILINYIILSKTVSDASPF